MALLRLVNSAQKLRKIGRLINRPKARERLSQTLHVTLGQKPYGYDAFVGHS